MNSKEIYTLDWQYDYWADIKQAFPIGSIVRCKVTRVDRSYAFLTTEEGVTCYLYIKKVSNVWIVRDLTEELEIGEQFNCVVCEYDFVKKNLTVSLNINQ